MQACRRATQAAIAHLQEACGPPGRSAMRLHRGRPEARDFGLPRNCQPAKRPWPREHRAKWIPRPVPTRQANGCPDGTPGACPHKAFVRGWRTARPTRMPSRPRWVEGGGRSPCSSKISRGRLPLLILRCRFCTAESNFSIPDLPSLIILCKLEMRSRARADLVVNRRRGVCNGRPPFFMTCSGGMNLRSL